MCCISSSRAHQLHIHPASLTHALICSFHPACFCTACHMHACRRTRSARGVARRLCPLKAAQGGDASAGSRTSCTPGLTLWWVAAQCSSREQRGSSGAAVLLVCCAGAVSWLHASHCRMITVGTIVHVVACVYVHTSCTVVVRSCTLARA
jgi:hypothetical protein